MRKRGTGRSVSECRHRSVGGFAGLPTRGHDHGLSHRAHFRLSFEPGEEPGRSGVLGRRGANLVEGLPGGSAGRGDPGGDGLERGSARLKRKSSG